jgi:hypothetical protein
VLAAPSVKRSSDPRRNSMIRAPAATLRGCMSLKMVPKSVPNAGGKIATTKKGARPKPTPLHLELQCLAANPDIAARSPPPASAFAVAPPTTAPPTTAERSIPIDTIVPIVLDMAAIIIAVAMTVAGKCGRRKE